MASESTPALDVVTMGRVLVDFYPDEDGPLTHARTFRSAVGGSPANVAIACARLGLATGFLGCVGDDPLGRFVRSELETAGVDATGLRTLPHVQTPLAVCEITPPHDGPLAFYRPSPPADLQIELTAADTERARQARVLWASLSGLAGPPARDAVLTAFESHSGRLTVLDLDFRPSFWASVAEAGSAARLALGYATIAVGNVAECRIALGLDDSASADDAADALLATGVELAIVKQGSEGVLGVTATERRRVAPVPVHVINGLGAGDAFGGALCAGLLEGLPLSEILRLGNAAGALVASRRGASEAMPTRREVDELAATAESRRRP